MRWPAARNVRGGVDAGPTVPPRDADVNTTATGPGSPVMACSHRELHVLHGLENDDPPWCAWSRLERVASRPMPP